MVKTLKVMNGIWGGKKVAISISEDPGDYAVGTLDCFEWVVDEDYKVTKMPKLKVIFSETQYPEDPKELIVNVETFGIKQYNY